MVTAIFVPDTCIFDLVAVYDGVSVPDILELKSTHLFYTSTCLGKAVP